MIGRQKLLLLMCAWMLLVVTLCPGAASKRGGGFRGIGKGLGSGAKGPPSPSQGSSRQGLKLAGAAAAGALGGAAVGFGLGSLGKPKHGHGHNRDSASQDRLGLLNQSEWRYQRGGASPLPVGIILLGLSSVVAFLLGNWVRVG